MADVQCPHCRGDGSALAFCDWHNERGEMEGDLRCVACFFCGGVGTVTEERMKRYKIGMGCRKKRLAADFSQMEMANRIGKRPSEISRMERGDCTDAEIAVYAQQCDQLPAQRERE